MNNEQEIQETQQATAPVTPPPFRSSELPQQEASQQEPTASPTLADKIAALGVDEQVAKQLNELTAGIDSDHVGNDLLATLARGITHDNDVQDADTAGYLRGRNEKIEAVLHPDSQEEAPQATPIFPRYSRRSIWD